MKNVKPKLVESDWLAKKPTELYTNTVSLTS
jgi:hypothetical protein